MLNDNVIDSRRINERVEELESDRQAYVEEIDKWTDRMEELYKDCPEFNPDYLDTNDPNFMNQWRKRLCGEDLDKAVQDLEDWDDEYGEYLTTLQSIQEQGQSFPDWDYGTALISEDYFRDYAMETANDIYDIEDRWPYTCIDWDQAAEELKMDYSTIEAGGYTFYIRD